MKEIKRHAAEPDASISTMTLFRGGREIQILYLGRGHTDTDVVVYLPKERIVCTGDLMESVISYMGDSYPEEWIATLERLKALDFDTVMPGHGVVFKGKAKIEAFQSYLRDVITQVTALRKQGLTADDAAAKVDLTKYARRVREHPRGRDRSGGGAENLPARRPSGTREIDDDDENQISVWVAGSRASSTRKRACWPSFTRNLRSSSRRAASRQRRAGGQHIVNPRAGISPAALCRDRQRSLRECPSAAWKGSLS